MVRYLRAQTAPADIVANRLRQQFGDAPVRFPGKLLERAPLGSFNFRTDLDFGHRLTLYGRFEMRQGSHSDPIGPSLVARDVLRRQSASMHRDQIPGQARHTLELQGREDERELVDAVINFPLPRYMATGSQSQDPSVLGQREYHEPGTANDRQVDLGREHRPRHRVCRSVTHNQCHILPAIDRVANRRGTRHVTDSRPP